MILLPKPRRLVVPAAARINSNLATPSVAWHAGAVSPQGFFDPGRRGQIPWVSSSAVPIATPYGPGLYGPVGGADHRWSVPLIDLDLRDFMAHFVLYVESFGTASSAFLYQAYESGTSRVNLRVNSGGVIPYALTAGPDISNGQKPGLYSVVIRGDEGAFEFWVNGELAYTATNTTSWGANNYNDFGTASATGTEAVVAVMQAAYWYGYKNQYAQILSADPSALWERERIWVPASAGGGGNTITVPTGALGLTGFSPTVSSSANQTIAVPLGELALTGFAPTVSASADRTIDVPLGTLELTGFAPTVSATGNNTISVPLGELALTGYPPSVSSSADKTIEVPLGTLELAGYAPTVSVSGNNVIAVPSGSLTLTGYAPSVSSGGASVVTLRAGSWIRYIQIV